MQIQHYHCFSLLIMDCFQSDNKRVSCVSVQVKINLSISSFLIDTPLK